MDIELSITRDENGISAHLVGIDRLTLALAPIDGQWVGADGCDRFYEGTDYRDLIGEFIENNATALQGCSLTINQ